MPLLGSKNPIGGAKMKMSSNLKKAMAADKEMDEAMPAEALAVDIKMDKKMLSKKLAPGTKGGGMRGKDMAYGAKSRASKPMAAMKEMPMDSMKSMKKLMK